MVDFYPALGCWLLHSIHCDDALLTMEMVRKTFVKYVLCHLKCRTEGHKLVVLVIREDFVMTSLNYSLRRNSNTSITPHSCCEHRIHFALVVDWHVKSLCRFHKLSRVVVTQVSD